MHEHEFIGLQSKTLKGYIWSEACHLRQYMFWRVLSVLAVTPFTILSQRIVDDAIPSRDLSGVWYFTGISFALLLLHYLTMNRAVAALSDQTQEIFRNLRGRIFHKLNFMQFRFLDTVQTGRLLSKYAFDTSNIEATVIQIVTGIIPELLRTVLLILTLAYINIWLVLIVFICIPIFAIVRIYYYRPIEDNNQAVRVAREKMTGQANEFISAIKLVRGFGQESVAKEQMGVLSDAYSDMRVSQMNLNQSLGYIMFTVVTALSLFAVAFCGWLVIDEKMTMGALVALVGALPICLYPVTMMTQFSLQYLLGAESYRSIKELMDSRYVEEWNGTQHLQPMRGEIQLKDVSFGYGDEDELAIENFSTTIQAGEHVAFVGPSGSGKSTLVSLILGFYAPRKGEILIDGVAQSQLAIKEFRQDCAIVMQDNLLLSGTMMDNIRFGKPTATVEEVRQAAQHANALEFIEELPAGFETKVGERGVSLSGGQRQRIAIARALLRNPKVLILDEATSALDYESEKSVQEAIDYLAKGRTTITIAHRLSTIRSADRIIVLKGGHLVSEGSWNELAEQEGAFKDLLNAQH
ncbi:MAG: ABC transporter ATP-binding protein/permease [Opitutales bacterium]|jgi:ATP-binding cassette, subfamily B, bacterial|nr:ABC transporter ATP-binding protein/permease [Opitutales bacterium]MDP4645370.1 ABC transporter ATP-binding protein/permease [Opitutales bacterium]MDP4777407.1 ABC transporter ATP-binding protein/permease [Opitutales bacterium]MDP4882945.1 ABC transporter ATP-binding protein/permease [Opitutales bacterium]MDP5080250.1 ABC transporter ATP-binding protein/permease [Opitutales bacterium]